MSKNHENIVVDKDDLVLLVKIVIRSVKHDSSPEKLEMLTANICPQEEVLLM